MKKLMSIILALIIVPATTTCAFSSPTAKLTAKVIDEAELPVAGAQVILSFSGAKIGDGGGLTSFGKEGLSDSDGLFSGSAATLPLVGVVIDKKGYYRSIQKYEFTSRSLLLNRWQPWNPTIDVVLKKIRNPVPMFHKFVEWEPVPALDKPVGYDLEKGDWVAPYGKGQISDFIFEVKNVQRARADYECSYVLTFSNEKDGIQEYFHAPNDQSYYKWPFEAPLYGYQPSLARFRNDSPGKGYKSNEKKGSYYIYRVRTKTDKDGNILSAQYGKVESEIRIIPGKINFSYYFNPDGTRNLEEDPDKNLFKK